MDLQVIKTGTLPNDGTGDTPRVAWTKQNAMNGQVADDLKAVKAGTAVAVAGVAAAATSATVAGISDAGDAGKAILAAGDSATARGAIGAAGAGCTPVQTTAYTANANDLHIAIAALTTGCVVTLPAASAYPLGQDLVVADETGLCSAALPISVVPRGADTILGNAAPSIGSPGGVLIFRRTKAGTGWTVR
ncbi:hypothetical protein MKK70_22110 [Methylobacterium sp. E-041]|uniref:hypothetical protein n=1 Tax=Methylobacterium sp. E-041 TaxID=2836573 RepID=UPI001FBA6CCB|nr:hypothetical protein [Methylobacterium sp. E-041]MCJ2108018.1 hypothetical protein [Methylobacterium sp. E-041]